jgi:rubredoxin
MVMSEIRKCPKCGGEMKKSRFIYARIPSQFDAPVRIKDGHPWGLGDEVVPYYCKNCGFVELYKAMKGSDR